MTDKRFFVPAGAIPAAGGSLDLSGSEGKHAATVMRIGAGETVLLSDGAGVTASATVASALPGALTLTIAEREHVEPASPRLTLVQALAKGGRDEMAVEAATELGVDAVLPWQADRSIAQWRGPKVEKGLAAWRALVFAAAKQSRRVFVPEVLPLATTKQLVGWVEGAVASETRVLVLHETAPEPLSGVELAGAGGIALVVGPEGGISDAEVAALVAAGAVAVRLGSEVLRASTAGPAALAALQVRLGRW
ncbi:16S rRNA (uracil(1498)-N(3))-methyltransferase [Micrococcales bacterium 31B]|nr:16S rRNA (uracil(1498)-N(3))-methyltransferase [Micrococcales bacterium 31B]